MKYDIKVDGHDAVVTIEHDSAGKFSGRIFSAEFGNGEIFGVVSGEELTGTLSMRGYNARFSATTNGEKICGRIRYGIFINKEFSGQCIA